jgi:hypothetical protein
MTLTDTQLVLLSAASRREDGAIVLTPNLKGSAAGKVIGKLLRDGLVEEVPAGAKMPVWRRDDEAGPRALRIAKRGLAAIGVDGGAAQEAAEAQPTEQRADGSPKRPAGAVALRQKGDQGPQRAAKPGRGQSKQSKCLRCCSARKAQPYAKLQDTAKGNQSIPAVWPSIGVALEAKNGCGGCFRSPHY